MVASRGRDAPNWGWGMQRQLLACRLCHALGLVVVLGMLLALGWTPAGRTGQSTAEAAPLEPNVLLIVVDDARMDGASVAESDTLVFKPSRDAAEQRWTGIRTPTHTYVRYDNGDEELYDLIADPDQQTNLAHNAMFAAQRIELVTRLDALLAR